MPFGHHPDRPTELAISVSGASAQVFLKENGNWWEVKPGAFNVVIHKTTALVFAVDSAQDVMNNTVLRGWVESWSLTLTHEDRNSLRAYLVRSVNNYLRSLDYRNAEGTRIGRFFILAFGRLRLIDAR
jgi:hypothetical protein